MHEYKVGIIIPIYNAGNYLEGTIKNVMAQKEMTEALENCGIDLRQ